jgi:hypothetical protein
MGFWVKKPYSFSGPGFRPNGGLFAQRAAGLVKIQGGNYFSTLIS